LLAWATLLLGVVLSAAPVQADEPEAAGRFSSVPPTLSGDAITRLLQTVEAEFTRFNAINRDRPLAQKQVFKAVFDFNPRGDPSRSDDYEFCLKLANGIRKLQQDGVQTIAFVHGDVSRHSVLPVLACQQVVMSARSKLGPVTRDGERIPEDVRKAYERLAVRFAGSPDLVSRLFDRDMTIVQSRQGGWVDSRKANEAAGGRALFESGDPAIFDFNKARQANLCELDAHDNREDLADAYRLPRSALQENPLIERVVPFKIPVEGEVTAALRERLERRLRRAMKNNKANLIVLELKCHGGDTAAANGIAKDLTALNLDQPDRPVVTIAYVTPQAGDTATIIALGCNYIVMDPSATLGGFGKLLGDRRPEGLKAIGDGVEDLAKQRHYSPVLVRGFVDRSGDNLFLVKSAKGSRETAILTSTQLDRDRNERPGHWLMPGTPIPMDERGFVLLAAGPKNDVPTAQSLGLAYKVGSLDELYGDYGLSASQVKVSGADWLEDLTDFLQQEYVKYLLATIGITCLFLELKMPGVGLPGVLAALCFVLFFWSGSKEMGGQVMWLAVLLFLLGLVLIGLEIFVLPGFGVCGISGILLVLGSLALVTYGKWPQDAADWVGLSKKVAPFGLSLVGALALAILLARYLPSIPYFNRLLLKPQTEETEASAEVDPAQAKMAALLGAIGVAATPLRPAGKVQFGEEFIDVVTESSYVMPGTRVQVIEIEGNRVVVKAV
jgi:membrane-bound ClpP family serine protease